MPLDVIQFPLQVMALLNVTNPEPLSCDKVTDLQEDVSKLMEEVQEWAADWWKSTMQCLEDAAGQSIPLFEDLDRYH